MNLKRFEDHLSKVEEQLGIKSSPRLFIRLANIEQRLNVEGTILEPIQHRFERINRALKKVVGS